MPLLLAIDESLEKGNLAVGMKEEEDDEIAGAFESYAQSNPEKTWWESVSGMVGSKGLYKNASVMGEDLDQFNVAGPVSGIDNAANNSEPRNGPHEKVTFEQIAKENGVSGFGGLVTAISSKLSAEKLEKFQRNKIAPLFISLMEYLLKNDYLENHPGAIKMMMNDIIKNVSDKEME